MAVRMRAGDGTESVPSVPVFWGIETMYGGIGEGEAVSVGCGRQPGYLGNLECFRAAENDHAASSGGRKWEEYRGTESTVAADNLPGSTYSPRSIRMPDTILIHFRGAGHATK